MPAIDSNHSYASRPPRREPAPPPMPRAPVGAPLRGGLAPGPSPRQVAHPSFPRALPQQPFRPAQQQAQRRVERAAVALPKQPTPIIPHVANPTPRQTHVALQLVRSQIGRILGPNPTTQRLASFQQELANDPRQRPFLQSVQHYVDAAEGHLRAELQRHPLQRYNAQLEASTPTLQQYRAEGIPGLLREQASEQAQRQKGAGPLPTLGAINPNDLLNTLATAHVLPGGNLVSKLVNEAIDIPAQTFLSGAVAGDAARRALGAALPFLDTQHEGSTAPAQQILASILHQAEHPVQSFKQAPLSTALLAAGGENVLGRLAGRVGEAARTGDAAALLRRAPSPPRPDLNLYGGEAQTGRTYNADVLRKAAQLGYEKALPQLPGTLAQTEGPFQATGWRLRRNMVGGITKVGRVDRIRAAGEDTRRTIAKGEPQKLQEARPPVGADVGHALAVQRVVNRGSAVADLEAVRHAWAQAQASGELKGQHLGANKRNLANLDQLLAHLHNSPDPEAELAPMFASAERHIQLGHPLTAEKVIGGALQAEQLRASLFPYAQFKMGARHFTSQDLAALRQQAAVREQGLQQHVAGTPQRLAAAEHGLTQATVADRLRKIIDLANRPGTAGEQDAAIGMVGKLKAQHGIGDLRRVPSVDQARRALQDVHAGQVQAQAQLERVRAQRPVLETGEAGLRGPNGEHLPNEAILQHMAAHGIEPPGYISHKTGIAGRGSFYKSTLRQPSLERFARTGASIAKGTADHSWEASVGSLAKQATDAAALQVRRRELNRLAIGPTIEGQKAAQAAADNFNTSPEGEPVVGGLGKVVPVHLGSGQIMERGLVSPGAEAPAVLRQFGLEQHTPLGANESGKFALIPEKVAKRMQAHDRALSTESEIGRGLQLYQQAFRRAKLNTSVPHIAGVVQEQAIRLGAETAGVQAGRAGAKFMRNLNELGGVDKHGRLIEPRGPGVLEDAAARTLQAKQRVAQADATVRRLEGARGPAASADLQGAHQELADAKLEYATQRHAALEGDRFREYASSLANRGGQAGSQKANDVVRKGDQFSQTSALGYLVHGAEGAARSRAGETVGKVWAGYRNVVEGNLARVEHATRSSLLGKQLRESGMIRSYRQLIGMTDEAVKDLIRGTMTPNKADALAHALDDMGGNWNRQTPAVRTLIGKFAPFGLWWLNSMRWLYRLPVTHPVKTAIAAALYQATRAERNKKGQGYDAAHPVPNFLQGTIDVKNLPLLGSGKIAPTYYSPGGTLGPELGNTLAQQLFPQFQGIYASARNQNALSGARLETAGKRELQAPQTALNVLGEILEGPIPFATQVQKVVTRGGKPYGTANLLTELAALAGGPRQIKPGSERSWLEVAGKLISPTRFDFPSTAHKGKGGLGPVVAPGAGLSPRQRLAVPRQGGGSGLSLRQQLQQSQQRGGSSGGLSLRQRLALGQRANSAYLAPGVEPGVSGKELLFQHNRAFGPGPIRPFIEPPPAARAPRTNVVPLSPNGVYRGGRRPQPLGPGSKGHARRRFAPVV